MKNLKKVISLVAVLTVLTGSVGIANAKCPCGSDCGCKQSCNCPKK